MYNNKKFTFYSMGTGEPLKVFKENNLIMLNFTQFMLVRLRKYYEEREDRKPSN